MDFQMDRLYLKTINALDAKSLDEKVNKFIGELLKAFEEDDISDNYSIFYSMRYDTSVGGLYCFIEYGVTSNKEEE